MIKNVPPHKEQEESDGPNPEDCSQRVETEDQGGDEPTAAAMAAD